MTKKILFIAHSVTRFDGAARMACFLANHLSATYQVDIISKFAPPIDRKDYAYALQESIKVIALADVIGNQFEYNIWERAVMKLNRLSGVLDKERFADFCVRLYSPIRYQKKLIQFINKNGYDLVIGEEGFFSAILGSIAEKINAKTIGWQHNSFEAYFEVKDLWFWKQKYYAKTTLGKLNRYVVLNEIDKQKFSDNLKLDVDYIYNPRSFDSVETSMLESNSFLAVGRFAPEKQFDKLIEAYNKFRQISNADWKLHMVGEGAELPIYKNLITKFHLEQEIIIHPYVQDIKPYYYNASCLLMTSKFEGFALVVLEALTTGLPIVAFEIPAYLPALDNSNSILVKMDDINALAAAMKTVAENSDLRKKLGKGAKEKSERFSPNKIHSEWDELIDRVLYV